MWSNNFYNFANYFNIFFFYNIFLSSFVVMSDKSSIFVATKQSKRII